ncbi:MAG: TRAP transporter TatT component family protein, partial [Candidatus Binatia bacterium]
YAFGFTENEILANKGGDRARYDKAMKRAKLFYGRAKDYGIKLLSLRHGFEKANEGTLDQFNAYLKNYRRPDLEKVFWATFAWGNHINFNKDSVEAVAELPRVEALAQRILALDEGYFYGGAHLLLGAIHGGRPKMLGGDPDKAKMHFERAIQISQGKYLMAQVTMAQYYAVQIQDAALYKKLLNEVVAADAAALPEQRLSNELAKIRAQILLDKQALFFSQGGTEKKRRSRR